MTELNEEPAELQDVQPLSEEDEQEIQIEQDERAPLIEGATETACLYGSRPISLLSKIFGGVFVLEAVLCVVIAIVNSDNMGIFIGGFVFAGLQLCAACGVAVAWWLKRPRFLYIPRAYCYVFEYPCIFFALLSFYGVPFLDSPIPKFIKYRLKHFTGKDDYTVWFISFVRLATTALTTLFRALRSLNKKKYCTFRDDILPPSEAPNEPVVPIARTYAQLQEAEAEELRQAIEEAKQVFNTFFDNGCGLGISYKIGARLFAALLLADTGLVFGYIALIGGPVNSNLFAILWAYLSILGFCGFLLAEKCVTGNPKWLEAPILYAMFTMYFAGAICAVFLVGCVDLTMTIPDRLRVLLDNLFGVADDTSVRCAMIGLFTFFFLILLYNGWRHRVFQLEIIQRFALLEGFVGEGKIEGTDIHLVAYHDTQLSDGGRFRMTYFPTRVHRW